MRHSDHKTQGPALTLVASERADAQSVRLRPGDDLEWSILMARAQDGDNRAYHRLLTEITPYVRTLVGRYHRAKPDIEDTTQDILLTIHAVRQIYDPTRPFMPWLVAISHRRIVDRLRRQGRTSARETSLGIEHDSIADRGGDLIETRSDARLLRDAVETLPPGQRDAVKLLKLQEMTLKDAAAKSGMSITALKVATHRALKSLRKILERSETP